MRFLVRNFPLSLLVARGEAGQLLGPRGRVVAERARAIERVRQQLRDVAEAAQVGGGHVLAHQLRHARVVELVVGEDGPLVAGVAGGLTDEELEASLGRRRQRAPVTEGVALEAALPRLTSWRSYAAIALPQLAMMVLMMSRSPGAIRSQGPSGGPGGPPARRATGGGPQAAAGHRAAAGRAPASPTAEAGRVCAVGSSAGRAAPGRPRRSRCGTSGRSGARPRGGCRRSSRRSRGCSPPASTASPACRPS